MEDQEPEMRLGGVLAELEHLDVPVRVPGSEHGPTTGSCPDVHGLLRAVDEVVRRRLPGALSSRLVGGVRESGAAADDAFARYAVHLGADRSHEVTPTTRGDVVGEAVCLEVTKQLDHRGIRAREISTTEGGVGGVSQE